MKKLSLIAVVIAATGVFELAAASRHISPVNGATTVSRNTIDTIPKRKHKRNPDPNPSPIPSPTPSPNPNPSPSPPSPTPPSPTPPTPTPPSPTTPPHK